MTYLMTQIMHHALQDVKPLLNWKKCQVLIMADGNPKCSEIPNRLILYAQWVSPTLSMTLLLLALNDMSTTGPNEPQALSYWAISDVFEESFFPVHNESFHGECPLHHHNMSSYPHTTTTGHTDSIYCCSYDFFILRPPMTCLALCTISLQERSLA